MRVLIFAVNFFQKPYPVYPLGAAAAAEAARRAGHEVRLVDLLSEGGFEGFPPGRLEELVREFRPEAVGLSLRNLESTTGAADENWSLAGLTHLTSALRRVWSGPVFLGGAGFSLLPEQALASSGADYGLPGEAEEALPAFLESLAAGRAVPGLQARPRPTSAIGPAVFDPALVRDYDGRGGLIGVQTQRGCAFGCLYCAYPILEGRSPRFRPTDEVLADLARLVEILLARPGRAGREICVAFADAVFNDPAGRWRELLAALAEAGLPIRWTAFFQPTAWAPGDLELIRRSGAAGLEFGTDAASDTALAGLNKPFDFETVRRVQAECAAAGLPAAHHVVFGGPGETEASVAEGLANL
ncbi:MAG: cobalamin-dependent protein, partial [Candidatus Adiutrix sp.]|nr:cobalamin-dependent protein [Candidatus Adiutrix sp.]